MKKTFLFAVMMMAVTCAKAQVTVNSTGNVGIGSSATQPLSMLSINASGLSQYTTFIGSHDVCLRCERVGTSNLSTPAAIEVSNNLGNITWGYGVKSIVTRSTPNTSGGAFGVFGSAGNASNGWNFGVFGHISGSQNGAGVYGTSTSSDYGTQVDNRYAGYFNGPVKVQGNLTVSGNVNALLLSPSANSFPTNGMRDGNAISTLLPSLQIKTYYTEMPQATSYLSEDESDLTSTDPELKIRECPPTKMAVQIASKQHYGLDADQLEEVFPDLVYENEDGTKSINYVEMVPILVQAINELNAKIEVLEGGNAAKKAATRATGIGETGDNVTLLSLGQNKPNPFGTTTSIDVSIPESVQNAFIYVYELQGKKVEQVDITARGKQTVQLNAANLSDGMYLYSLIADGKVVETRRMIVEK